MLIASGCAQKKQEVANKTASPQSADKTNSRQEPEKSPTTPRSRDGSKADSRLDVRLKKRGYGKGVAPGMIGQPTLPQLQLPLARPTSFHSLPPEWLADNQTRGMTLGTAHNTLLRTLKSTGLTDGATYYIDGGFVIATQLEQIDDAGKPLGGKFRFDLNAKPRGKIWQRLFLPQKGRWRMLLLIVTDADLHSNGKTLTREEAAALAKKGSKNGLPTLVAQRLLTPRHECTAFVYEFEQKDDKQPASQVTRSPITAETHLAGFIAKLKGKGPKR